MIMNLVNPVILYMTIASYSYMLTLSNILLPQESMNITGAMSMMISLLLGTSLLCLFFHLLCYAAVLKILTYYAQYYAHVKMICA